MPGGPNGKWIQMTDSPSSPSIQIDSFLAEKDEIFEAVFDVAAEYEETDEVPSDAQRQEL